MAAPDGVGIAVADTDLVDEHGGWLRRGAGCVVVRWCVQERGRCGARTLGGKSAGPAWVERRIWRGRKLGAKKR